VALLVAVGRWRDRLGMTMDDAMAPIERIPADPSARALWPGWYSAGNSIPLTFSGICRA
jgi:hypothetical protein